MPAARRTQLHLLLALDIDEEPVGGTLRFGAGARRRFDGWLELIAGIEAALQRARTENQPRARRAARG